METQLGDNDNQSESRLLGAIFLILGWMTFIGLFTYILLFASHAYKAGKDPIFAHTSAGTQITLFRQPDSHYRINGSINDVPVIFIIDTGADSIAVTEHTAVRAKLVKRAPISTTTANGTGSGYLTIIDKVLLGDIELRNLSAMIIPSLGEDDDVALLGMNILSKFDIVQSGDTMTITVPNPKQAKALNQ